MTSISKNNSEHAVERKLNVYASIKKYFLLPLKEGLYGFILVLAVILFVKLLSFLLGINESFNFDIMDILLSSVGFFFMFLIYFLKKLHQ